MYPFIHSLAQTLVCSFHQQSSCRLGCEPGLVSAPKGGKMKQVPAPGGNRMYPNSARQGRRFCSPGRMNGDPGGCDEGGVGGQVSGPRQRWGPWERRPE